jgi:hypothetical protein
MRDNVKFWLTLAAVADRMGLLAVHVGSRRERVHRTANFGRRHNIGRTVAEEGIGAAGIHFGHSRLAEEGKGCGLVVDIAAGCTAVGHRIGCIDRKGQTL